MIQLQEALRIVLDSAHPLKPERAKLNEALGRILAEDIAADMDVPPFDKATMDGYACRRADLGSVMTEIETITAGRIPAKIIGPNQCAKIMTGAAVPTGADCVIMIEQTQTVGKDAIRFLRERTLENIFRRAQDIRAGQIVLAKGEKIGPRHVAVLASVGCAEVPVARQPRVGVIATGDELVAPEVRPEGAQIRNSNGPQLLAQLAAMGLRTRDYGIVKDAMEDINALLKQALAENDVVIVSAGVSAGDFDLVPEAMRQNQVRLLFEKIAVKPGKPTVFGVSERTYCFGLPGNPVSTFVVFELLLKPFLCRLMGHDFLPVCVRMRLDETVERKDIERQSWIPVTITGLDSARPVPYHGSAHLSALCEADGLISIEVGVARLERGTPVRVRLL
jgi:molybdopterin molybdotransferase